MSSISDRVEAPSRAAVQSSFYAELQPIKNLRIKSQFGYIMGASSYRSYLPRFDYLSASLNNAEDKVTQSMSM